ncbi:MAG: Hsp20/alpha crystallin family protein [Kiritimatiellia bacterium]
MPRLPSAFFGSSHFHIMAETGKKKTVALAAFAACLLFVVLAQTIVILRLASKSSSAEHQSGAESITRPQASASRPPHSSSNDLDDPFDLDLDLDNWDPFQEMRSLHERIDKMFGNAFGRLQRSKEFSRLFEKDYVFSPDINLEDRGDHYLVTVDLPGVENTRLDVKLDGQTLTISGSAESPSSEERQKGRVIRLERKSGRFFRSIVLPSVVKADEMTTTNRLGVLYIRIPKA